MLSIHTANVPSVRLFVKQQLQERYRAVVGDRTLFASVLPCLRLTMSSPLGRDTADIVMDRIRHEHALQLAEDRWCAPRLRPLDSRKSRKRFVANHEYNMRQLKKAAKRRAIIAERRGYRGYLTSRLPPPGPLPQVRG